MIFRISLLTVAIWALAACGTNESATEADFGNSKASLIKAQTANPGTPSTQPVTGVDPDYADKVIEAMRESVSKPEQVQEPIQIQIGGQRGS